jgi:hypothetical protein
MIVGSQFFAKKFGTLGVKVLKKFLKNSTCGDEKDLLCLHGVQYFYR